MTRTAFIVKEMTKMMMMTTRATTKPTRATTATITVTTKTVTTKPVTPRPRWQPLPLSATSCVAPTLVRRWSTSPRPSVVRRPQLGDIEPKEHGRTATTAATTNTATTTTTPATTTSSEKVTAT